MTYFSSLQLRGSINTTLSSWGGSKGEGQSGEVLTIQRVGNNAELEPNDTSGNKTTVKLFLSNNDSTQVEDAIKTGTYMSTYGQHYTNPKIIYMIQRDLAYCY